MSTPEFIPQHNRPWTRPGSRAISFLATQVNGQPAAFLDGPAGTQVPTQVMHAIQNYLMSANANTAALSFQPPQRRIIAGTRVPWPISFTAIKTRWCRAEHDHHHVAVSAGRSLAS